MTRAETWQRSATCYESSWSPVTGLFASSLLDSVRAGPGRRLLDLACGPGPVAVEASRRGCASVGVDAASAMVRLAVRRLGRSLFAVADAQRPPFAAATFDAVTINFGLHHFEDPATTLVAVGWTLRPGARLGYTVWAADEENPALEAINRAFAEAVPPDAPRDFPFGDADRFREALIGVGYHASSMEFSRVERQWRPRRPEDVFEAELKGGGRKTELLARQSAATKAMIRSAVVEVVRGFQTTEGIAIPMTAYVISARRRGGDIGEVLR